MKNKFNKKEIRNLVIGAVALLILLVGGSFAYFGNLGSYNFTTRTISGTTEGLGNVALTSDANLTLSLTNAQLMDKGTDIVYYSTSTGTYQTDSLNLVETQSIGEFTATGNGNFKCTYTLSVNKTSTNDLYDAFQGMSTKSEGQIILRFEDSNGVIDYDFNTENLFTNLTYTGKTIGINSNVEKNIKAALIFVNKTGLDQSAVAGKDITLSFDVSSFNCDVAGEGGKYILANNTLKTNLSATPLNDLLGENTLYRYQGDYNTVTNNYICFGTYDKDLCTTNTERFMYRILGIAEDGTMKLIKNEAMSTGRQWTNKSLEAECVVNGVDICTWPDSTLYNGINGSYYLTNTSTVYVPTGWADKIQMVSWKYGDITTQSGFSADASFTRENAWTDTVNAKIGLMYIYDYYYANGWDGNQSYTNANNETVKYNTDGWIHRSHTDNNTPNNWEWLLSRYGLTSDGPYRAWTVLPSGHVNIYWLNSTLSVRPVFYLVSDVSITGEGTINSPYLIN